MASYIIFDNCLANFYFLGGCVLKLVLFHFCQPHLACAFALFPWPTYDGLMLSLSKPRLQDNTKLSWQTLSPLMTALKWDDTLATLTDYSQAETHEIFEFLKYLQKYWQITALVISGNIFLILSFFINETGSPINNKPSLSPVLTSHSCMINIFSTKKIHCVTFDPIRQSFWMKCLCGALYHCLMQLLFNTY